MVSFKLLALGGIQLLSAVASPAPTPTLAPELDIESLRQTHRLSQVEVGKPPPGPVAYLRALAKYKKPIPTEVQLAASAVGSETASVQASDRPHDESYLVNVTVGKAKLLMNFDTGSSDFWVFSTLLPASQRGSHHLYGLGGHKNLGATWDISYSDGAGASGVIYADQVRIGGVTVATQAVEAATSVSTEFVNDLQDGLVGLGFEEGNKCEPSYCFTFMDNAASLLPKPLFTATLRHGKPGVYDFGFVDPSLYTGALTTVQRIDNTGGGYWEFNAAGYSLNGGPKVTLGMDAIADTGTSLLLVPQSLVNAYYAKVPSAHYNSTWGAVIFPCANANTLPSLGFYLNGTVHTMPAAYGVYDTLPQPAGYCYGGVQYNGGGVTVLGDVFLKSQFVVFNYNSGRLTATLQFAQQRGVTI